MFEVKRPKVKHLTGSFRGSPLFPERDDLEYVVLRWYHLEGGRATLPKKLQDGDPVFTAKVVHDRMGDAGVALLAELEAGGDITSLGEAGGTVRYAMLRSVCYSRS